VLAQLHQAHAHASCPRPLPAVDPSAPAATANDASTTNFNYASAGRSTPGIDGPSFTAWHANFAHGLQISTAGSKQGAQPVGFLFTGTSNGSPTQPAVVGGTPTATQAYGVVVASAPITYEALLAVLKPGVRHTVWPGLTCPLL